MKQRGEKIAMLTAYDYSTARIVDEAGIPLILVGDIRQARPLTKLILAWYYQIGSKLPAIDQMAVSFLK